MVAVQGDSLKLVLLTMAMVLLQPWHETLGLLGVFRTDWRSSRQRSSERRHTMTQPVGQVCTTFWI